MTTYGDIAPKLLQHLMRQKYMGTPTPDDPLGQKPDADDMFRLGVREIVAAEIRRQWQGRASERLDGIPNEILAMELIARGWIAYKPSQPK